MKFLALLLLALTATARAEFVGVEGQLVLPRYEDREGLAFAGSIFTSLPKMHGCLQNGLFLKPGTGSDRPEHAAQSFGYYMGFLFVPRFPLIRPGVFAGISYDDWVTEAGREWRIHPLYGVQAQVSLLSLSFSGRGIGLGINFGL